MYAQDYGGYRCGIGVLMMKTREELEFPAMTPWARAEAPETRRYFHAQRSSR
jgi:hypothetical protein